MRTESMVLNNEEKVVISREEFRVLISQVFGYGGKEKWGRTARRNDREATYLL
jgi:hypothetical protein